jgi:hypothetical protein
MVDLQEQLAAVNDRITSGVVVPEDEYQCAPIKQVRSAFNDDVDFAWERII